MAYELQIQSLWPNKIWQNKTLKQEALKFVINKDIRPKIVFIGPVICSNRLNGLQANQSDCTDFTWSSVDSGWNLFEKRLVNWFWQYNWPKPTTKILKWSQNNKLIQYNFKINQLIKLIINISIKFINITKD